MIIKDGLYEASKSILTGITTPVQKKFLNESPYEWQEEKAKRVSAIPLGEHHLTHEEKLTPKHIGAVLHDSGYLDATPAKSQFVGYNLGGHAMHDCEWNERDPNESCPHCSGTGEDGPDHDCPECDGSGEGNLKGRVYISRSHGRHQGEFSGDSYRKSK